MSKTIKYVGTQTRWPELAATGKQSVWNPGQQEERSDAEATALMATTFFIGLLGHAYVNYAGQVVDKNGTPVEGAVNLLVSGTPGVGNVLTASYPMGVGTVKWQNFNGTIWSDIAGETSLTHTQTAADALGVRPLSTAYAPYGKATTFPAPPLFLSAFRTALGNRNTANVRIAVVGDSWTDGWLSSGPAAEYVNQFQAKLRAAFTTTGLGSAGGLGYRTIRNTGPQAPYTNPWVLTGTTLVGYFGLGLHGTQFGSSNKAVISVASATSAIIQFQKSTAAGSMYYKVDGGSSVNFNTGGFGAQSDDGEVVVSLGASGAHSLEVGYLSGTATFCSGAAFYDGDESKGITVFGAGHPSYTTANFLAPSSGVISHNQRVGKVNPHLTLIVLGVNDFSGGSKLTAAQYGANLQAMIDAFRTAGVTGSFLLVSQGDVRLGMSAGNNPLEPWANYVAAAAAVAAADPSNVSHFDLSAPGRIPASPSTTGGGLWADNLHLGDTGHAQVADLLVGAITTLVA